MTGEIASKDAGYEHDRQSRLVNRHCLPLEF